MFAARGIAVSSSVFFLLYLVLSLAVCGVWRRISVYSRRFSARNRADLLFALRMFPFLAAATVTAAFTVPSFLLLEPRAIDEGLGGLPLALGLCGVGMVVFGTASAMAALNRAWRMIARWTTHAKAVESPISVPVMRIDGVAPALTAAGILRPKILLSGAAAFVLNESELQTALRHEFAHVLRRDNLKKLLLRFVAFPGMKDLESAWLESTEMAADDAAVGTVSEALDLAAALIKLSKISVSPEHRSEELMTAFASSSAALMNARVKRLIAWSQSPPDPAGRFSQRYAAVLSVTVTVATAFAVTYSQLLAQVHEATEWLVR